jgi:hypothetical protein
MQRKALKSKPRDFLKVVLRTTFKKSLGLFAHLYYVEGIRSIA